MSLQATLLAKKLKGMRATRMELGSKMSSGVPKSVVPWFGVCIASLGAWHVGSSLAQFSDSTQATVVSQAVYSVPVVGGVSELQVTQPQYSTIANEVSTVSPASYTSIDGSNLNLSPSYVSVVSSTASIVPSGNARDWALEVANARSQLNASRLPDIAAAKSKLAQAMNDLESFLATSPEHQANWLAFLKWSDLQRELAKDAPDYDRLVQIEKTFRQNYLGLEYPQFTNVRESLKHFANAVRFGSDQARSLEILGNRLGKLSEQLQMPEFTKDFENTRGIGQTLLYLHQANQNPELVSAVRSNFARSNLRVLVSSEFVQRKFTRPVNEANPVNEVILGTQIYGQSWLNGSVSPQLLDSSSRAAFRLNLNGSFSSQSIGYNRSVKLHTEGAANIVACETIALTDEGLVTLNDASADAGLSSHINDIEAKLKIVRKIASKQAAKQKPQADAIAEGRLENRIRQQFHEKLTEQISQANEKLKTPDLPVLRRLGLDRPKRTTWSSSQYMALLWKLQDNIQLAAPASCPLPVETSGVTVQLHESVITNLVDPVLAGRILRSTEMETMSTQFGSALANKRIKEEDEQPWAITMESFHPVEIQLDNNLVTFRIRTTKLDRGDQALEQPASIEASYKVVLVDGSIDLERQGEVKIDFSGKQQRGVRAVTLRSFLKKKFDEVFREKLLDKPFRLSDEMPSELADLRLNAVSIDDGWIQAHIQ